MPLSSARGLELRRGVRTQRTQPRRTQNKSIAPRSVQKAIDQAADALRKDSDYAVAQPAPNSSLRAAALAALCRINHRLRLLQVRIVKDERECDGFGNTLRVGIRQTRIG